MASVGVRRVNLLLKKAFEMWFIQKTSATIMIKALHLVQLNFQKHTLQFSLKWMT